MERRTLGRTGLDVSRVCLGTMTFGSQVDTATAGAMVDYCLDRGVDFIDTANAYGKGASETMLGEVLRGRRHRVILASKVGLRMGEGTDEGGLSRGAILRAVDDSLRRLRTDYLDVYYLHQPDYTVPLEESLAALDGLVRQGKVRAIAASNYAAWQLCRLLWLSETASLPPVCAVQPMCNLLARGVEQELVPMCRAFGLAIFVYNPLAGGLLSGKQRGETPLAGTRFDRNQVYLDRYWNEANRSAVVELERVARQAGRSLVGLAFAWLLHHAELDGLVLGASRFEQLEENFAALEAGPLAVETVAACDDIWQKLRGPSPQYNR